MKKYDNNSKTAFYVWDLATRLYHWVQLVLVVAALILGFFGPEWLLDAHIFIGYGIFALIIFRVIWGFFGPEFSRFSSFLFSFAKIKTHVRGVLNGNPAHSVGHNPLGGLMVFALIAVLGALSISGIVVLGGVENQGPLAGFVGFAFGSVVRFAHEILAFLLVGMIVLHIVGVLVESYLGKTSLTRSMIDGKKRLEVSEMPLQAKSALGLIAGFVMLGAGALFVGAGVVASAVPPSGLIAMPVNESFNSECADCHEIYHPSLLPSQSWNLMMEDLSDHFGEDASLSSKTTIEIMSYLSRYSAEAWDTEAANFLREVDAEKPFQITATPFWIENHSEIPQAVFETRPVTGKANCSACHKDALSGVFADQQIQTAHGQS